MASGVSRVVLIAGVAVGVGVGAAVGAAGLATAPAAASNFVTLPAVTGVANVTPSSATLTGAVDTGGDPGTSFSAPEMPGSNLSIDPGDILNGIPTGQGYVSNVLFEVDPMRDYVASGNQPGGETEVSQNIEVPTTTGLSAVETRIGAYPAAKASGSAPLKPGTEYVYFIVQQVGVLVTAPPAPGRLCACSVFFGGNATNFYQSPVGTFTTPKLGSVAFGADAPVRSDQAAVTVDVKSRFKVAGTLTLSASRGGRKLTVAHARISAAAGATEIVDVKLTRAGIAAVRRARGGLPTTVKFLSATGQPSSGKTIRLKRRGGGLVDRPL